MSLSVVFQEEMYLSGSIGTRKSRVRFDYFDYLK